VVLLRDPEFTPRLSAKFDVSDGDVSRRICIRALARLVVHAMGEAG